ncbi:tRNA 2-thiocytidine(32) synthetase TtcA [Salinimonas marina]|uniref:tRNA-cytidine(32) 2-sulfurtransferase n=1 Tax=Salinimonas marina TaxID=2785918 RepID=A0A7S9DZW1_9ALTE|nr:tRNA 2-thiocytidine(32) synthetase TtcA [Salinimonas marina]
MLLSRYLRATLTFVYKSYILCKASALPLKYFSNIKQWVTISTPLQFQRHYLIEGKDSYTMLDILLYLRKIAPISFDIIAVNLDQKQPGFPEHVLPEYLDNLGVDYQIVEEDTYSIVKEKVPEGKTTCALCSRLRRGILYRTATELGATKIALGHHRDDMLETLFLNMFHGGKLKSMPPKLVSDDGQHIVIRPLAYCSEKDIEKYSATAEFPIIPCNLCGSQENLQRQNIKHMLQDWNQRFPGRIESMFKAMQNVAPSHLLDRQLHNFEDIARSEGPVADGDTAFDEPQFESESSDADQPTPVQVINIME